MKIRRNVVSDISAIGLGSMGSALAHALLKAGHGVTVWNRTPQKMVPFAALGANCAASIIDAIQASPLIMVCIDNYAATKNLLATEDIMPHLSGRTLIQFSTGTPKEARESEAWLKACGGEYIDGALMPYPSGIGAEDAQILFAGPETVFERCKPFLTCLGGDLRYLGPNIAAAAALDFALLSQQLGNYLGAIHGAHLCESEKVSVDLFASMFPEEEGAMGEVGARHLIEIIHKDAYDNPGATISVWGAALQRIQDQARDAGINSEVPDFVSAMFKRAIAAGHGEEDIAALIKVLRADIRA